ncbi:MAG: hypothetical protein IPG61_17475 [bacterium]|nr:hypothetical protein [bacterium]
MGLNRSCWWEAGMVSRMSLGVAVPLVVVIVPVFRSGSQAMASFSALFMTAQVTCAVTTSHKEIIAASRLLPAGAAQEPCQAQFSWAAGLAVVMAALPVLSIRTSAACAH